VLPAFSALASSKAAFVMSLLPRISVIGS
jgi:hypothetical protein